MDFLLLKSLKLWNPKPLPSWQRTAGLGSLFHQSLKIPHGAPRGLPEPCRLPIRGRCWNVPGTEGGDLPNPQLAQAFSLLHERSTHCPCSLSRSTLGSGSPGHGGEVSDGL